MVLRESSALSYDGPSLPLGAPGSQEAALDAVGKAVSNGVMYVCVDPV